MEVSLGWALSSRTLRASECFAVSLALEELKDLAASVPLGWFWKAQESLSPLWGEGDGGADASLESRIPELSEE